MTTATLKLKGPSGPWRLMARLGLALIGILALATTFGAGSEYLARRRAHEAYPAPGQRVDIGGRKMHIHCLGSGSPTVILESGLDSNGSLAWEKVQGPLSKLTRTCAYDRAGVMWSDPKPGPQTADGVAADLKATLSVARIEGPLVMVCHSLGGPYIMAFTRNNPDRVKGLVFVDCSHPDQITRLKPTPPSPSDLPWTTRIAPALAWTGIVRAMAPADESRGLPDRSRIVGKAYLAETVEGTIKEMVSIPITLKQGGRLRDLGDRPLVVLTALEPYRPEHLAAIHFSQADGLAMLASWKQLNLEAASWSKRSRQQDIPDSGHYIQYQRPDLVIAAVAEVVATVRADAAKAKP